MWHGEDAMLVIYNLRLSHFAESLTYLPCRNHDGPAALEEVQKLSVMLDRDGQYSFQSNQLIEPDAPTTANH